MSDDTLPIPEMLEIWQQTLSWQPSTQHQKIFQQLYQGILAGNQQFNLTRITEPIEFWEKHLWDSLRGVDKAEITDKTVSIIDIGTGAGFPGIPIAIAYPQSTITLLDSTRKKITFLEALITQLELKNTTALTGRAEEIVHQFQHRRAYDLALVRAVGAAPIAAKYALPLLKPGGLAILYRGHWTDEEAETLKPVLEKLGGVIETIDSFTTPISDSIRHCIYLRSSLPKRELPIPIKKKE